MTLLKMRVFVFAANKKLTFLPVSVFAWVILPPSISPKDDLDSIKKGQAATAHAKQKKRS